MPWVQNKIKTKKWEHYGWHDFRIALKIFSFLSYLFPSGEISKKCKKMKPSGKAIIKATISHKNSFATTFPSFLLNSAHRLEKPGIRFVDLFRLIVFFTRTILTSCFAFLIMQKKKKVSNLHVFVSLNTSRICSIWDFKIEDLTKIILWKLHFIFRDLKTWPFGFTMKNMTSPDP